MRYNDSDYEQMFRVDDMTNGCSSDIKQAAVITIATKYSNARAPTNQFNNSFTTYSLSNFQRHLQT